MMILGWYFVVLLEHDHGEIYNYVLFLHPVVPHDYQNSQNEVIVTVIAIILSQKCCLERQNTLKLK